MAKNIYVLVRNLKIGGGLSKWVVDYYRRLSEYSDIKITLLVEKDIVGYDEKDLPFKCVVLGGKNRKLIKQIRDFKKIIEGMDDESVIHFHTDNLVNFIPLLVFKNFKERFIVQSHSSVNYLVQENTLKKWLNFFGKKLVVLFGFSRLAISNDAGKWLFDDKSFGIIKNGIDIHKFGFFEIKRQETRKKLNIDENAIVYGHVGRFDKNKNQKKLISIFNEIHKINSNSFLLMIGEGNTQKEIKHQVEELRLQSNVKLLGLKKNVSEYLSAMDVFIFPSYFEGFGFALVEAQATGLKVFYSDSITKDIELIPGTESFNIHEDDILLARNIISKGINSINYRKDARSIVKNKGYTIEQSVDELHTMYREL
ncbi:glycosyltransferase [Pediococcus pentosaceus]|uniref:glycosyltransferase n=1 Tax=Pediococcus pentosaceus TaxID=1255 RepID=UPI003F237935